MWSPPAPPPAPYETPGKPGRVFTIRPIRSRTRDELVAKCFGIISHANGTIESQVMAAAKLADLLVELTGNHGAEAGE